LEVWAKGLQVSRSKTEDVESVITDGKLSGIAGGEYDESEK
jgi:hypothetical protein